MIRPSVVIVLAIPLQRIEYPIVVPTGEVVIGQIVIIDLVGILRTHDASAIIVEKLANPFEVTDLEPEGDQVFDDAGL